MNPWKAHQQQRDAIREQVTEAAARVKEAATWQTVTLVVVALVAVTALAIAVAGLRKADA